MTAVNIERTLHFFTYDVIVLSDGVIMRLHTPVSFNKALRNLFLMFVCRTSTKRPVFYIFSDGLQLSLTCFLVTCNATLLTR